MNRRGSGYLVLVIAACVVVSGVGARAGDVAHPASAAVPTFSRDIAPLVFANCVVCHRPGEVAPFSLLTWHDVRKHGAQIVKVTSIRQMPPWKAVSGHGQFRGERILTDAQIGLLKQWVDEGMSEGDPKEMPAAPKFASGWQMGEPDLVVKMSKPYAVAAEGPDIYRNFVIPIEIPAGKFIRAVEFRPGNRRVVHHAGLSYDTSGKFRARDGEDGAPGFTSAAIGGSLFPGPCGFWVPGKESRPLPEGVSFPFPHGADFLLQLHLHPSGKPEVEQSTIGFYFTTDPPHRPISMLALGAPVTGIPAGEKSYATRAERTLERDCDVFGIFPHMHLIGKTAKITAVLPDGTTKSLLQIDDWDFNWQSYYEYAQPLFLPRGTRIIMENTHDNSAENPNNPNHPPKPVAGGVQTTNEMSAVLINFFPRGSGGQPTTGPSNMVAQTPLEQARDAIRRFDTDGDGKLSLEEIKRIPGAAGQDIAEVIRRFDTNGDGKLDAEELARAIEALRAGK